MRRAVGKVVRKQTVRGTTKIATWGKQGRLRVADTRGQAMVEFALVLPVLVLVTIAAVEFGIVMKDWINTTDTARIAARAAAVARFAAPPNDDPCTAARNAVSDAGGGATVKDCNASGSDVTVTVQHPWAVSIPLIPLSTGGSLTSSVTEQRE